MRKTAKEIYDSLSKEFIRRGIGSDDFSKLNELYTWAEIGEEAKSEYKKIQDLEAKLSTQWDSGYRHGAKEASGKIKSLEAQLAKSVKIMYRLTEFGSTLRMVEEIELFEKEIEKGE